MTKRAISRENPSIFASHKTPIRPPRSTRLFLGRSPNIPSAFTPPLPPASEPTLPRSPPRCRVGIIGRGKNESVETPAALPSPGGGVFLAPEKSALNRLSPEEQELHRRANRVAKVSMQDIKMLRPE